MRVVWAGRSVFIDSFITGGGQNNSNTWHSNTVHDIVVYVYVHFCEIVLFDVILILVMQVCAMNIISHIVMNQYLKEIVDFKHICSLIFDSKAFSLSSHKQLLSL